MSPSKDELLERNVGNLVRHAALPHRPEGEARARAAFLERVAGGHPPRRESGRFVAVAASFLAGAIVIWSMMPASPPPDASSDTTGVPAPEGRSAFEEEGRPETVVREGETELAVRPSAWTEARPNFRVKGRIPAKDGTVLSVVFQRYEEAYRDGRLVPQRGWKGTGRVRLESKEFSLQMAGDLGPYEVEVLDLEGPGAARRWTFRIHLSGRRFAPRLTRDFEEAVRRGGEARDLVEEFQTASINEQTWRSRRAPLERKARKFLAELQDVQLRTLCTASIRELSSTLGLIVSAMASMTWEEGKLKVRSYYEEGRDLKTHRGEKFSVPAFIRYVDEAIELAGREALLCVIRERRNGRELDAPLEALLDRLGPEGGLRGHAARLRGPSPDLAALEKAVRAGR